MRAKWHANLLWRHQFYGKNFCCLVGFGIWVQFSIIWHSKPFFGWHSKPFFSILCFLEIFPLYCYFHVGIKPSAKWTENCPCSCLRTFCCWSAVMMVPFSSSSTWVPPPCSCFFVVALPPPLKMLATRRVSSAGSSLARAEELPPPEAPLCESMATTEEPLLLLFWEETFCCWCCEGSRLFRRAAAFRLIRRSEIAARRLLRRSLARVFWNQTWNFGEFGIISSKRKIIQFATECVKTEKIHEIKNQG